MDDEAPLHLAAAEVSQEFEEEEEEDSVVSSWFAR